MSKVDKQRHAELSEKIKPYGADYALTGLLDQERAVLNYAKVNLEWDE